MQEFLQGCVVFHLLFGLIKITFLGRMALPVNKYFYASVCGMLQPLPLQLIIPLEFGNATPLPIESKISQPTKWIWLRTIK